MNDPIGDRMKALERAWSGRRLDATRPAYARIDGRGFSRLTVGLRKPFDRRMSAAMERTATHLLESSQARAAYVQSDEISLLWAPSSEGSELFFGGKPQKMASVLAGMATAAFTRAVLDPELDRSGDFAALAGRLPHFDARVVGLEESRQAAEMFAWRGADARRNAVSGLARTVFSHRQVQNRSTGELLGMLDARGVRLDAEDPGAVNGVLLRPVRRMRRLSGSERMAIPARHRPEPGALFERRVLDRFDAAPLPRVANLEAVLFEGEEPEMRAAAEAVLETEERVS